MRLHGLVPVSLRGKIPEFLAGWKSIFDAVQCAMRSAPGGAPPGSLSGFVSAPGDASYGSVPVFTGAVLFPRTVYLIRLSEDADQVVPFALAAF